MFSAHFYGRSNSLSLPLRCSVPVPPSVPLLRPVVWRRSGSRGKTIINEGTAAVNIPTLRSCERGRGRKRERQKSPSLLRPPFHIIYDPPPLPRRAPPGKESSPSSARPRPSSVRLTCRRSPLGARARRVIHIPGRDPCNMEIERNEQSRRTDSTRISRSLPKKYGLGPRT